MDETGSLHILHLEDDANDADLIKRAIESEGLACRVRVITSSHEYLKALDAGGFDLILSDSGLPGLDPLGSLQIALQRCPKVPFLFVSGGYNPRLSPEMLKSAGAADCLHKSDLSLIAPAIRRAVEETGRSGDAMEDMLYLHAMERLITIVQELSLARTLQGVTEIVRKAARDLTGADGATFVLNDNGMCYYADEDAIAPLWKGQRFPLNACISGWAMLNRKQAVIEDIYADTRVPHDAYRPTFVKSLVMVPIRLMDPIGAIGTYWANPHAATAQEVKLLQALADTTAVAMENVQVYAELDERIKSRTAELEDANKELEAFSYAVSHDLRAPLRHIDGYVKIILEDFGEDLADDIKGYLQRIHNSVQHMGRLIEDLLQLSRLAHKPLRKETVDLGRMAWKILADLQSDDPDRRAQLVVAEQLSAHGDPGLLEAVMQNLLSNAWKFTARKATARIEVGKMETAEGQEIYYVRDNGVGFDMAYVDKLFRVFQRLHLATDFPGTGVGLATVQRIIANHGGRIWVDSVPDEGTVFYFTLA